MGQGIRRPGKKPCEQRRITAPAGGRRRRIARPNMPEDQKRESQVAKDGQKILAHVAEASLCTESADEHGSDPRDQDPRVSPSRR